MENRLSTDSTAATYKTQSAKIAVDKPFSIEVVAGMPTTVTVLPTRRAKNSVLANENWTLSLAGAWQITSTSTRETNAGA